MSRPSFSDDYGGNYLLIEPGEFRMGDLVGDGLDRELPVHNVIISRPFSLVKDW